ncbi:MAG: hypothetical protein JWO10_1617, partial [Microbacteriaceae bacterium]|nr:hypothetical protein [Microbacteriaceae bacterium]
MTPSPQRPRRATARDVAELVGCSVATVSLVVNGKAAGRLTPSLQERVRAAVRQLDYRVNSTASALATGTPTTVAFVSPDPANPFFALVLEGLVETLDEDLSVTLLVPTRGGDYDPRTVQRALAGDLAGLVLVAPSRSLLDALIPTCPVVLLDAGPYDGDLPAIELDVESAARHIANHLVDLGHRRFAYVGADRDKLSVHQRREALAAQLHGLGASLVVPDVLVGRISTAAALEAVRAAWPEWQAAGVTAVVCGDDLLAYGVLQFAQAEGVAVPGRLSVTGFNDLPYSGMVSPSLTTVDLSARELGRLAAAALNDLVGGTAAGSVLVPTRLVVR